MRAAGDREGEAARELFRHTPSVELISWPAGLLADSAVFGRLPGESRDSPVAVADAPLCTVAGAAPDSGIGFRPLTGRDPLPDSLFVALLRTG
jgi:hypothetical protein